MDLPTAFRTFLQDIRPTQTQRDDYKRGHITLRERLLADPALKGVLVAVFIQGSYRRSTAIRPHEGTRSDVDLVVVTNIDRARVAPNDALGQFVPFLRQHYGGKWKRNERSLGIELSYVELDLVVTSSPSQVELVRGESSAGELEDSAPTQAEINAWKLDPLWIPNRQADRWEPTHPLRQLAVTREKNARCNGHFVNVVKALKWWKRQAASMPKHPKSYPLERLLFELCPDAIPGVAEGVTRTLEAVVSRCASGQIPSLDNPGVTPPQNVLARVPAADFAAFIERARSAARLARRALDSRNESESFALWRELFGQRFPAR